MNFGTILTYCFYFLIAYAIYLFYLAIVKPFLFWFKYRNHPNVYTYPYFIPIFGDLWYHLQDMKNGRAHYKHKLRFIKEWTKYDLKVRNEGINCVFQVISNKAIEEFVALQPTKIDNIIEYRGITKCVPHGFINARTTKKTFDRRKLFTNLLNLNKASLMIPGLIARCSEFFESIPKNTKLNFGISMNNIIFNMFMNVLYGKEIIPILGETRGYINPDNSIEEVNFCEFLIRVTNSHVLQNFNPVTTLFPYLNK